MREWSAAPESRLIQGYSSNESLEDGSASQFLFFGLIGITSSVDFAPYGSREFGYFARVSEFPNANVLSRAIRDVDVANTLARYAPYVSYELAISADLGMDAASSLALRIVNALRVKTRADLLVPAQLSMSWSKLHRAVPGSCHGKLLEDVPSAMKLEMARNIEQEDFDWLFTSGDAFEELLRDPRFSLAVESLCYCHLLRDARMMAAGIWAGIEALCGVKSELRFRISLIASAILEPRGERRKRLCKRLQKLYDVRSQAVHGGNVAASDLFDHVIEVRILLAQLVMECISAERLFTEDDVDKLLLL